MIALVRSLGVSRFNLHKISLKGNALENAELSISASEWRSLVNYLEKLPRQNELAVRYEVGYATKSEFESWKATGTYHEHVSGSYYSNEGNRVVLYADGNVYISSEAFGTDSHIGSLINGEFVPNLSLRNELCLTKRDDFNIAMLSTDRSGDAEFPHALSVSFRRSIMI
jgi:MoaA/NifB/PqqE/SkfB family radical SAM enzyme